MFQTIAIENKYLRAYNTTGYKVSSLVLIIVFLFTLAIRLNTSYNFRELNSDKARQLHGAYELMHGNGVSIKSYNLENFQPSVKPIIDWPPAYSYITAAISFITQLDLYSASVLLDFLCITALWIVLLWFTRLLLFSPVQKVLLFLFLGFSKTPIDFIFSADLIGTTLFLISCCLNIKYTDRTQKGNNISFIVLQFLLIVVLVFLKYSLLPAVVALGLSLFSYTHINKIRYKKTALVLLGFVFLAVSLLAYYNYSISGHSPAVYNRGEKIGQTFYFSSLTSITPFVVSSFFYLDPFLLRFNGQFFNTLAQCLTVLVLVWLILEILFRVIKKKASYFDHLVLVTVLAVTGFLCVLSIVYPKNNDIYQWTYVKEYRYFAPAIFMIIIYVFRYFNLGKLNNIRSVVINLFVITSVFYAVALAGYYWLIKNKARSFDNLYGKVLRAADYAKEQKDANTYFLSLTGDTALDAEATSIAATYGTKTVATYYGYFPEAANALFDPSKTLMPGKKVIVFMNKNWELLNKINKQNKYTIVENAEGEHFLVIKN